MKNDPAFSYDETVQVGVFFSFQESGFLIMAHGEVFGLTCGIWFSFHSMCPLFSLLVLNVKLKTLRLKGIVLNSES